MRISTRRHTRKLVATAAVAAAMGGGAPLLFQMVVFTQGSATLTGSSFQSGDGDQTGAGTDTDWANATSAIHKMDTVDPPNAAASLPDYSFGQGAKEDIPNPNIVTGSIPPNKSDLTDFLTAYETKAVTVNSVTSNHTFLYLGWKRTNNLGNANMDFEFDQNPHQVYLNPAGTGTPQRLPGDLLVTFDFPGSGSPVVSLFKWVDSSTGTKSDCFSASALPCWGKGTLGDLGSNADSGVSTDTRFGEAGIDLTAAGAFAPTGCTTFGDALLKSRSSSSFTSEIKDFVELPQGSISVSNCGSLKIHKTDNFNVNLGGVGFTLYNPNADNSAKGTATDFTCTTDGDGNCTFTDSNGNSGIPFGNYWISETTPKSGYNPVDDFPVTVTATSGDSAIGLTDRRAPAEITFTKQDDASHPLKNAVFTLYKDTSGSTTDGFYNSPPAGYNNSANVTTYSCTTTAAGLCDMTNINDAGPYWIVETTTPTGYTTVAPYHITVALAGNYGLTDVFQDPRQFTVITLVCVQNTATDAQAAVAPVLYGAKVAYDGGTQSTVNSPTAVPAALAAKGVTAADLCNALGGNVTSNHYGVGTGSHTSTVVIP